jgi:hypothetical protein
MKPSRIYVRSDDKDRRRLPEPEGPGLFDTLREKFDDATLFMRRHVSGKIRRTMNELDKGEALNLSEVHRAAVLNQLNELRARVNAGGVDGLVASGRALIECARLKPA